MAKQKRYTSEAQILKTIDRAHALESKDIQELEVHHKEAARLRKHGESHTINIINHHKAMIDLLEKRIKGRGSRLERIKHKLAEFRTLVFPGMTGIMDETIAR